MAAAVPMDPNYPSRVQSTEMPSYGNLADFRLCDYETAWKCMQWRSSKRALAVYCTGAGVSAFVSNSYFLAPPDQKGFIHQGLTLSWSMNTHEGSWRWKGDVWRHYDSEFPTRMVLKPELEQRSPLICGATIINIYAICLRYSRATPRGGWGECFLGRILAHRE